MTEVLIVIGIFALVGTITFYFFAGFSKKATLEKDTAALTALINNAKVLSFASKNTSVFGIRLENDKAVLFRGASYVPGGEDEKVVVFANNVYLYSHSLNGGGSEIIFDRLTGNTSNYGTIVLSLTDHSASTTITILPTGVIE